MPAYGVSTRIHQPLRRDGIDTALVGAVLAPVYNRQIQSSCKRNGEMSGPVHYLTPEGKRDLERELLELTSVRRKEIAEELRRGIERDRENPAAYRLLAQAYGRLGDVVLASPDIDVDVFKTQLQRIGKRPDGGRVRPWPATTLERGDLPGAHARQAGELPLRQPGRLTLPTQPDAERDRLC